MLMRSDNREATVEQIAAATKKTAKHIALEAEQRQLSEQWAATHAEQRRLVAAHQKTVTAGGVQGRLLERQFREIEAQLKQVQNEQRRVSAELQPLRTEHGRRLGEALRPKRRELAEQALDGLADLNAVWVELEQLSVVVEAAGGSVGRCPPLSLGMIERELARLAAGE